MGEKGEWRGEGGDGWKKRVKGGGGRVEERVGWGKRRGRGGRKGGKEEKGGKGGDVVGWKELRCNGGGGGSFALLRLSPPPKTSTN